MTETVLAKLPRSTPKNNLPWAMPWRVGFGKSQELALEVQVRQ